MSGSVAEAFSRKYGILIATAIFIIGVVVQITAISGGHEEILAGRFITSVKRHPKPAESWLTIHSGIGVGGLSVIVPMYNSECAPP
jgi:MFS family permease